MGILKVPGVSKNFWEKERRIAEKLGSKVWIKSPPIDEDEWKKHLKGRASSLLVPRVQKEIDFLNWSTRLVIANRFDPMLANKKYRIAIDVRQPSRTQMKILGVFYWSWFVISEEALANQIDDLREKIRKEVDEKKNIFAEQVDDRESGD